MCVPRKQAVLISDSIISAGVGAAYFSFLSWGIAAFLTGGNSAVAAKIGAILGGCIFGCNSYIMQHFNYDYRSDELITERLWGCVGPALQMLTNH